MADWFPPFWASQNVTAKYITGSAYVNGLYQPNFDSTLTFEGVVLDTPENEISQLSYGNQNNEFITVYMRVADFQTIKPYTKNKIRIVKDGKDYTVLKFTERNKLLPHVKMIASRDTY